MPGSQAPIPMGAAGKETIVFDDASLSERCRRGDPRAFESLVAKYQDRIYNTMLRMCGRHADAEELAQETFLKALENIGEFRGSSGFYTWLFRIATNLAISHLRRGGRLRFHPLGGGDDVDGQAEGLTAAMAERRSPSPESAAMSAEVAGRVTRAIEELDEESRVVVVLRDVEDMDYGQIAEVLKLPMGTIKSRLHRARDLLKVKLADLVE